MKKLMVMFYICIFISSSVLLYSQFRTGDPGVDRIIALTERQKALEEQAQRQKAIITVTLLVTVICIVWVIKRKKDMKKKHEREYKNVHFVQMRLKERQPCVNIVKKN
jgi:SNF family Na+-dependent transporter